MKKVITYFKNGSPKDEHLIDSESLKFHGHAKYWHTNGKLWKDCNYKLGVLHGNYMEWTSNGTLFESSEFLDGTLISQKFH